jgi:hypothetical protein
VETLKKGLNVLEVLSKFESHFKMLSACGQAVLVADKVVMFLWVVDINMILEYY